MEANGGVDEHLSLCYYYHSSDALLGKERPDVFWLAFLARNLREPTDSLEGRPLDL